jgi:rod shape-determining protein MreC
MPSPMKPRNNKPLRWLGAVLIALVLMFGLMTATARERSEVTVFEKAIATVLYPLQVATDWVATRVRIAGEAVGELTRLREENIALREQVQSTAQLEARNQMLEQENLNLHLELQMKRSSDYPLLSARVISRTSDTWYRTVVIDRGSRDGVGPNMAVVNWQGLVGKVSHTTPYTATVQLVLDAGFGQTGFGAGAKLPTGELGVIETFQGGHVRMKFFSSKPAVQVGHPVYTSGEAVLPADLLIGYVESLGPGESAFDQFVNVRPAVDFYKLGAVHVVLRPSDKEEGLVP